MQLKRHLLCLALALCVAATGFAQDDEKKAKGKERAVKSTTTQMMKAFEKAKLTDEQKSKAKAIIDKHIDSMMEARKASDTLLTKEQKKARTEAVKKAKEEGLKGKDMFAKGTEAMGLSEEEAKKYDEAKAKVTEISNKVKGEIMALLTDEQKAAMPQPKGKGKGKGKGKKKKGDADSGGKTQTVSLKLPGMT